MVVVLIPSFEEECSEMTVLSHVQNSVWTWPNCKGTEKWCSTSLTLLSRAAHWLIITLEFSLSYRPLTPWANIQCLPRAAPPVFHVSCPIISFSLSFFSPPLLGGSVFFFFFSFPVRGLKQSQKTWLWQWTWVACIIHFNRSFIVHD